MSGDNLTALGQAKAFLSSNSRNHQSHLGQVSSKSPDGQAMRVTSNQNNSVSFTSHGRVPKMDMGVVLLD